MNIIAAATNDNPDDTRPVIWTSTDGRFSIIEATTDEHLRHDQHLIGQGFFTQFDEPSIYHRALSPSVFLERCLLRVFTLLQDRYPVATFKYSTLHHEITDFTHPPVNLLNLIAEDLPGPQLCAAFHSLRDTLPLSSFVALPQRDGTFISPSGHSVPATLENAFTAMNGKFSIPADITTQELSRLCGNRLITLNIDALPVDRLADIPALTLATLHTDASLLDLPQLRTGSVIANNVVNLRLPNHEVGTIHCARAETVELPLHRAGSVSATTVKTLALPLMEHGDVFTYCEHLTCPTLRISNVTCSGTAELPTLEIGSIECGGIAMELPAFKVGYISSRHIRALCLPVIEIGTMHCDQLIDLVAPVLTHAEIYAEKLMLVELPNLEFGELYVDEAVAVAAPKMMSGKIGASPEVDITVAEDAEIKVTTPNKRAKQKPIEPLLH